VIYALIAFAALCVVAIYSLAGRAHGAGELEADGVTPTGWPSWARTAAVVFFGITFAGVNYLLYGFWWLALFVGALTAFGITTGHGRFYAMRGANLADPDPEFIEKYLVGWWYKGNIATPLYSWVCMGVKGAMVGVAIAPFGCALALLWPACYSIGLRFCGSSAPAERMSGGSAGCAVVAACLFHSCYLITGMIKLLLDA